MFSTPRRRRTLFYFFSLTVLFTLPLLLSYNTKSQLETIREAGEIRVLTRNSPVTYFIEKGQPAGFEYELAKAFADYLGVRLKLINRDGIGDLIDGLRARDGHIAAAMLSVTPQRSTEFDFAPHYLESQAILVYRIKKGKKKPKSLADTFGKSIMVMKNSSHAELLTRFQQDFPQLSWQETETYSDIELMEQVQNEQLDFTVVDSTSFASQKSYYPGLRTGLELTPAEPIAWMLSRYHDDSINQALKRFYNREATRKLLKQLDKKYFQRKNQLNYFDTVTFKKDLQEKFSNYEQLFHLAEQETGLNWKLLAAVSYQESHWNPKAVSPTGVRGLMMLTQATAKEMGVTKRTDPKQSIIGGAHYLKKVKKKVPDRITEPDRTWFALAGYNVGYGHLEDARVLTARGGKNPDKWSDVRQFLPLLSKKEYYTTVRRGYARGREPVVYVGNIQKYLELIEWEQQVAQMKQTDVEPEDAEAASDTALESIPAAL